MASPKTLFRPLLRSPSTPIYRRLNHHQLQQQHRTFLLDSLTSSSSAHKHAPQLLTANRTLPYPSAPIYSIIADVPSYSSFLPYCQRSDITKWSAPDTRYKRIWPSEGILTSGFGSVTESFVSKVYCIPGKVVESVCGDAETSLRREDIGHHLFPSSSEDKSPRTTNTGLLLSHLRSKWTIEPVSKDTTHVSLSVEFAFTNPFYAALSGGAAPKVAEYMIKAFEQRVKEVMEGNPEMVGASLAEMDGSRMRLKE